MEKLLVNTRRVKHSECHIETCRCIKILHCMDLGDIDMICYHYHLNTYQRQEVSQDKPDNNQKESEKTSTRLSVLCR